MDNIVHIFGSEWWLSLTGPAKHGGMAYHFRKFPRIITYVDLSVPTTPETVYALSAAMKHTDYFIENERANERIADLIRQQLTQDGGV